MDVRTGDILRPLDMDKMAQSIGLEGREDLRWYGSQSSSKRFPFVKKMEMEPTPKQLSRKPVLRPPVIQASGRVGRNEPCPCGSGKKFKKCCMEV